MSKNKKWFETTKIGSFILRNSVLIIIFTVSLLAFGATSAEINTMLLIIAFETLAIGLSSLAAWAFTHINFTKDYKKDKILGYITLSVHILVGLVVFSLYLSMFS